MLKNKILVLTFLVAICGCLINHSYGQLRSYSPQNAHAHNDYLNKEPLAGAQAAGFGSVEADIFLRNGDLLVAHSKKELASAKTLNELYLQPLAKALNSGRISKLNFVIDLKDDYKIVLPVLIKQLKPLVRFATTTKKERTLTIVITGSRPQPSDFNSYPDYIFFDYDLSGVSSKKELERVKMVSLNFKNHLDWDGERQLTSPEILKVSRLVDSVHHLNKKFRFWGCPDNKNSWQLQMALGCDFIGTDKVLELAAFLNQTPSLIKVMSYNVHHCNPPSKPDFIDIDAVAAVINAENPDLVALQEIDVNTQRSGPVNQAEELAKKTGMPYFYFAKAIDHQGGDYGVAILSKYKISAQKTHHLPNTPGVKTEPRVMATVEVALTDNRKIKFASTHLDATKATSEREVQMSEIIRLTQSEALPMVIAGDFNATAESKVISDMDKHFQRSCSSCEPTIPSENPRKTIDFIATKPQAFFKPAITRVVQAPYPSDHLPVVTDLIFNLK